MKKQLLSSYLRYCLLFLFIGSASIEGMATSKHFELRGYIYQQQKNKQIPLPYASIYLPQLGIGTISNDSGSYRLKGVPRGKHQIIIQSLGMVPLDTLLDFKGTERFDFTLREENFRLDEVVVTAQSSKAGQATSSIVSKMAMEHLQAASLTDVLSLIPGGVSTNPTLNQATQLKLRSASNLSVDQNISGLGAAIIRNGAPISNNANMQTMNPNISGGTASLGGGASPGGGVDLRSISVSNIENIEVIRGIPSVEYGDLSSGAVIITSKAGRDPLRINAGINSSVYQVGASKGLDLGKQRGIINFSTNYAYTEKSPVESYRTYQRVNGEVLYSNSFFKNRLRTNTSFNLTFGNDRRKANPDDQITHTKSSGKDIITAFNTNGTLFFNNMWLKNIRYALSASYADKSSYHEQLFTAGTAPYSMTITDGAILSNRANTHLYDEEGKAITKFTETDNNHYAQILPSEYIGRYDIDGKEIGLFGKITANFHKRFGKLDNHLMIGTDARLDGNKGKGKTFDPTSPPQRNLSALNASFRPRSYKNIPHVRQLSLFAEERAGLKLGNHNIKLQAGLRWDIVSSVKKAISPRINASIDIIPEWLTLRGGYGITAKAPTSLYLYPEQAYFEYINLNEMGLTTIPKEDQRIITTTRIFDTKNNDLEMAKNKKAEIGFDLHIKQARLGVTAFTERMSNGYGMSYTPQTFHSVEFNEYQRTGMDSNNNPLFGVKPNGSNRVLSSYYTPTNDRVVNSKGIEFDLDLGRFPAIRTAISMNGSWIRTDSYTKNYTYFDENSGFGGADRNHVAMYEPKMPKRHFENMVTAVRLTHNIPKIGFVITLTAQTIWREANWNTFGNDSIPVKYINKNDGQVYPFNPEFMDSEEFKPLLRKTTPRLYIKESYSPLFSFNINITKELGEFMRISFFANNLFRSYPTVESKREPGTYRKRNQQYFFGMNLSLSL